MTIDARPTTPTPRPAAPTPPAWCPSAPERADLDLLQTGGYDPLTGFMGRDAIRSVQRDARLPDGAPWPAPVTLELDPVTANRAAAVGELMLTDPDGTHLAAVEVAEVWEEGGRVGVAGAVRGIRTGARWDFQDLRVPVRDIREESAAHRGNVLCVQPYGPVDRRTETRWIRAAEAHDADLLVLAPHPEEPERERIARIRSYRRLLDDLPAGTRLRLFPDERDPTVRDTRGLHAVVARNAGATHLVHDHPDDTDVLAGLGLVPVDLAAHATPTDPAAGRFAAGVASEIRRGDPPRHRRGFVVLLSGLSGSGKSTIARALRARLVETDDRQVTLLDGDLVRRHLSSELGFSREHRDLNVRRIGYVAAEIAKHGGIALCAPIAPYDRTRIQVRDEVTALGGGFVLVHVATPLEICEARDVKGLYARARAGELAGFTGIDDPYEVPDDAQATIDTSHTDPVAAVDQIVATLVRDGWIAS